MKRRLTTLFVATTGLLALAAPALAGTTYMS